MPSNPYPYLSAQYARWQERLAHDFFDGRRDQPVVMFVDRDELERLADPGEDGSRSLSAAVAGLVNINRGKHMFDVALRAQAQWGRGSRDHPPPTLPILALSVLAASEMQRDLAGARHNYYIRLARVLLPDGSERQIESLRDVLGRQGAFTTVAEMWVRVDQWLGERSGEFGRSTIREDAELTRIGYPQSQTLVRRSDRAALTRLFALLDMDIRGIPKPETLLGHLRTWTRQRPQGFSGQFLRSLDDASVSPFLAPLLHGLAEAWDGKIITAEGLRRLDMRLVLDLDRSESWWAIPAVRDLPGDVLSGISNGTPFTVHLTTDPYTSLYEASGLPPVSPSAIAHGLVVKGSRSVAEFQAAKLLVLEDSADAGGWMSVDAVQPYVTHAMVATPDVVAAVEQALTTAADTGWSRMPQAVANRTLPGYAIFYDVTFSNREALVEAVKLLPGSVAAHINVGSTIRPRLINGLPLLRNFGRDMYLAGGEPDLDMPSGPAPQHVIVTLDQDRHQPFFPTIFPIPFRRFGPYDDGAHTIDAEGERLTFTVMQGIGDDRTPLGTGSLSWANGRLGETGPGADVCGAAVTHEPERGPTLARRGMDESWLLHRTGRCVRLTEPAAPAFLTGATFLYFDVTAGDASWLVQKRRGSWRLARLKVAEPALSRLTVEERMLWGELVANVASDDRIWHLYRRAWAGLIGR